MVAALLFSVHPLRVESVVWATERRDVLCGFFFLASLLFHLESLSVAGHERRKLRAWSLVSYLLSLLSKAASVPLPVLLVVLDAYVSKKRQPEGHPLSATNLTRSLVDKVAYFGLAVSFAAVAVVGQARHSIMPPSPAFGILHRAAVAAYGMVFYLAKTLRPRDLSPLYGLPLSFDPLEPRFLVCMLIVLLTTLAALWLANRWPAFLAAWAWYVLALLPTSGVLQAGFQIAADRYTYLPSLSWAVLAGAIVARAERWLGERWPRVARLPALAAIGVIAELVFLTRAQTLVWHDTLSLWQRVVELEPDSITGNNNLGAALAEKGRLSEAITHFRFVLERDPRYVPAQRNLAKALKLMNPDEAPGLPPVPDTPADSSL